MYRSRAPGATLPQCHSNMRSTVVAGVRALLVGVLVVASPLQAQEPIPDLRLSAAEENLRATPGGTRIAVLLRDSPLVGGAAQERWREVTLQGWVREASVVATTRDGYDLAIATSGATIHTEPGGTILARGLQGFLLDEVSRREGWVRVRRTAWVWSPSIERLAAGASPAAPGAAAAAPAAAADTGSTSATRDAGPRTLHASPSGPQLGSLDPAARLDVVGREGEWARVRVEGWVRLPAGSESDPARPITDLSLRALRENPDLYRGRTVAWRVQFVSVQRADSLRTDFSPGEPYLLARDPDGEPGYVYIAVPQALLADARRLVPLQQVEVVARVRTGRSPLMGHPVLDLLEMRLPRS
jgi:hypothetical protein